MPPLLLVVVLKVEDGRRKGYHDWWYDYTRDDGTRGQVDPSARCTTFLLSPCVGSVATNIEGSKSRLEKVCHCSPLYWNFNSS